MKSLFLFPFAFCLLFTSCQKDKDLSTLVTLSDEEIVETIEAALKAPSGGSSIQIDEAVALASSSSSPGECGLTKDSVLTASGPQGHYSTQASWDWIVNCQGLVPTDIDFNLMGKSAFDGSRLQMNASIPGQVNISNLITGTEYILNGMLSRNGNSTLSTAKEDKQFSSDITFTLIDIKIDKEDYSISSGVIEVTLGGAVTDGGAYDRTGTLTFNGDGTATLVLDNGNSYTITLHA